LKLPDGIDEATDCFEVRPKPAVKQKQQQGKERNNYEIFQSPSAEKEMLA